ncbi:hypothetical protein MMC30_006057 [Trapelia coarctata]|nr:hypothetical protein [Trapelia coarctata]
MRGHRCVIARTAEYKSLVSPYSTLSPGPAPSALREVFGASDDRWYLQKFFGTNYGLTVKIPRSAFTVTAGKPVVHMSDNGTTQLHREFCGTCGSGILEFGGNAGDFTYITYGTLDEPEKVPPKGEFFCKYRDKWMPEVPDVFHKQELKE